MNNYEIEEKDEEEAELPEEEAEETKTTKGIFAKSYPRNSPFI